MDGSVETREERGEERGQMKSDEKSYEQLRLKHQTTNLSVLLPLVALLLLFPSLSLSASSRVCLCCLSNAVLVHVSHLHLALGIL